MTMRPPSELTTAQAPSVAWRSWLGRLAPLAALLLMVTAVSLTTPRFLHLESGEAGLVGAPLDILQNGAPVMLLALGMTLVIAGGGIDLSVGSIMALAAVAAAHLVERGGGSAAAIGAALAVGVACGACNGALTSWLRLPPIVATLVTLVSFRGLAQGLAEDQKIRFTDAALEWLANGRLGHGPMAPPVPIILVLVVAVGLLLLLRATVAGRLLEAVGLNDRAARLCGIRVQRVRAITYIVSGAMAALAGLLVAGDIGEADPHGCGLSIELDAILAVAIGGTALTGGRPRLVGSLLGAMTMRTLMVGLLMNGVAAEHTLLVKGIAAAVVCAIASPSLRRESPRQDLAIEPRQVAFRRSLMGPAALALLLLLAWIRYAERGFAPLSVLRDVLGDRAHLGVVAIGLTIVVIAGGLDLAVGAVLATSSVLLAWLLAAQGWPLWAALPATLAMGTLFGLGQGSFIALSRLPAFIVTLAGMFIARGLGFLIQIQPSTIRDPQHAWLAALRLDPGFGGLSLNALVLLATMVGAAIFLGLTRRGRDLHAVGGDPESARLMGVDVTRSRLLAYAISGFCAALGGVLLSFYISAGSHVDGVGLELDAIAAVVVGGTLLRGGRGSVVGTTVGVALLGLATLLATAWEGWLGVGESRVAIGVILLAFVAAGSLVGGIRTGGRPA